MISSSSWTPVVLPPWGEGAEFTLGSWTLPRSRDPGVPPVQQFILYATSPKLSRRGARDEGEEHGAFTAALLAGLRGAARRWSGAELLRGALGAARRLRQDADPGEARKVAETPGGALLQIPQDTGSRGVAGRPCRGDELRRRRVPEGAPRGAARPGHCLCHR